MKYLLIVCVLMALGIPRAAADVKTIQRAEAVAYQESITKTETVAFFEGGSTLMTPAQWIPERSDIKSLALDGNWEVIRWPFPTSEDALVGSTTRMADWQQIAQPGPVFYYDPNQSPHTISNWNRVTLAHLYPEDGAIIRRTVRVPREWKGKRILLRFEGIYPAGRIYWDGKIVGEQWSGLTRTEFDVTDCARPGREHILAVRLYRRHGSVQLDMPRHALEFTGLSRTAFLHAVESLHIVDSFLQPGLAEDYRTGTLQGSVTIRNAGTQDARSRLRVRVEDATGRSVAQCDYRATVLANQKQQIDLDLLVGAVKTWNAERPNLYSVHLELTGPGKETQRITRLVGFRRFELKAQRPLLNGNPVKFRGVNHLTFHPETGMVTPEGWLRECLTLMKRANVNAIRTHFYGPPELTELCDEMGFYLVQELPIDWGTDYVQEPVHFGPMLHRMAAGVRRDREQASVMLWSIGNENMPSKESVYEPFMAHLQACNQIVKHLDPTRPTMFPPPGPANKIDGIFEARIGDIADTHYSFNLAKKFNTTGKLKNPRTWEPTFETHTRDELLKKGWSGVWFSSEYGINNMLPDLLNAPYTSIIADVMEDPLSGKNSQQVFIDRLNREWGHLRDDPTCLGGAYFCWIAAGAGNPWGWTRWGEDADWGVVTGDLQAKPAFWGMRVLFSPVRFPERVVWKQGQKDLKIAVHNDYNSVDLSECILRVQTGGGPPWMSMLREWRDVPMSGAPGTASQVKIPIWNEDSLKTLAAGRPIVCRCTVIDPTGYRPITADILVAPETAAGTIKPAMPMGPDAVIP